MSAMASENPYLAGKPVYNGGSNAPTHGTVDPMGYIEREINQPSQKRSGLAQAALQKLQVPPQDPATAAPITPMGKTIDFTINSTGQLIPVPQTPAPVSDPSTLPGMGSPGTAGAGPNVSGLPPELVSSLAMAAKSRINGGQ